MSLKVDLTEFLSAYIAEVDEQLQSAGAQLLQIEQAGRAGERHPRAVRDLFRTMHTVKGLSAMVGVEPIVTIAHRMETALRDADRAGGAVAATSVEALLEGLRLIERSVRAVEKGSPAPEPPASFLGALDTVIPEAPPRPGTQGARLTLEPALAQKLDAVERDLLLQGALRGRRALRVDYTPTAASFAQGMNINLLRDRLGAIAEIVRVVPISIVASEEVAGGIGFALLVLTSHGDDEIAAASGLQSPKITAIVEVDPPPSPIEVTLHDDDPLPEVGPGPEETTPRRNLLRVDVTRVDDAMERLAALIVTRSRLARAIGDLAARGADTRELSQIAQENARQLRDLRASILQVRMVPLTEILERVPLMLRALTRTSGRQVRLQVEGANAELDKAVAERIFPAIVHLVRNAVDHGIESAEERARAGKPAEGTVSIRCSARSNTRLELSIGDDGRGVDRTALARRAGVKPPESDPELLELLCQPGLSTRDQATTTSGRGLGMDIVRRIIVAQLGGELSMKTQPRSGSTFVMQIPLTIAIIDGFLVECSGDRFVVPVSAVEEILEIEPERLQAPPRSQERAGGGPVGLMQHRREVVAFYALDALLGLRVEGGEGAGAAGRRRALVVRCAGEPIGFLLDAVRGQQEAVVRPLVDPLVRVAGVSAATDLGDGRPTLVLDLAALAARAHRRGQALAASGTAPLLPRRPSFQGSLP